jgi:molybdate transport system substrate-binding protein
MQNRSFSAWRWVCVAIAIPALVSCGQPAEPEQGPTVLAAASLQEALEQAAAAWEAQGHAPPVLSFAGTSALARQVEQGAPADVFFSADEEWMDTLAGENLLRKNTRRDLLGNDLVVIAPRGAKAPTLAELGDGKLALADPGAVPAGKYAKASLESLGLWGDLADNVVPAENVRAAMALVERGEAPLGVVYATDALASGKVEVVEKLPEASHPPIRYPAAVLAGSKNPEAQEFLDFLASDAADRIFEEHGFEIIE